jgi:hypothetical protein
MGFKFFSSKYLTLFTFIERIWCAYGTIMRIINVYNNKIVNLYIHE